MKYLDERIEVKVAFRSATTAAGLAQYTVTLMDDVVFVGNVYLESGMRSATVDITDIVRNTLTPLTFAGDVDSAIGYTAADYQFVVTINGAAGYSDFVAPIYRYPNAKSGDMALVYDDLNVCQSGALRVGAVGDSAVRYGGLLPRYPKAVSDDMELNFLFLGNEGDATHFWYGEKIDNINERWMRVRKTLSDVEGKSYAPYSGFISGGSWCKSFGKTITFSATLNSVASVGVENFATGASNSQSISSVPFTLTQTQTGVPQATANGLALSRLTFATQEGSFGFEMAAASAVQMSELWKVNVNSNETRYTPSSQPIDGCLSISTGYAFVASAAITSVGVRYTNSAGDYIIEEDYTTGSNSFTYQQSSAGNVNSAIFVVNTASGSTTLTIPTFYYSQGQTSVLCSMSISNKTLMFIFSAITYDVQITLTGNANGVINDMRLYNDSRYSLGYVTEFAGIECGGYIVKTAARKFSTAYTPNTSNPCWALWMIDEGVRIDLAENDGTFTATPNTTSDVVYVAYKDIDNILRQGWFKVGYSDDEGVAIDLAVMSSIEVTISGAVGSVVADAKECTDNSILVGRAVCPKGYFLLWQDRLGGGQCQPFEMVSTYSEDVTGSEITNYYGKRSLYKVEVQPKWKLNSGWLTDDEYRAYESLFVSPWIKLYNADENACYEVILKDRAYTEKTFENQGRRLFNLSVEVEQVETQGILY